MVYYILQARHIFIRVKAFILMLVPGRLQILIISTCFAWRPVSSIIKYCVLTAHVHKNRHINIWLLISCDTGIYAIIIDIENTGNGNHPDLDIKIRVVLVTCISNTDF